MFFSANYVYSRLNLGQKRKLFPMYKSFPTKHNIAHNVMLIAFVIKHLLQITIVVLGNENIPPFPSPQPFILFMHPLK